METYAQESLLLQAGQAKFSSTLPAAHAITPLLPAQNWGPELGSTIEFADDDRQLKA